MCVSQVSASVRERQPREIMMNCWSTERNKKPAELIPWFADSLMWDGQKLNGRGIIRHRLDTKEARSIGLASTSVPVYYQAEVKNIIEVMLKSNVFQPSQSPWTAPMVLVPKKDGKLQLCFTYRQVNSVTRRNSFPLPIVEDLFCVLWERVRNISVRLLWCRHIRKSKWNPWIEKRQRFWSCQVCVSFILCFWAWQMPRRVSDVNESCSGRINSDKLHRIDWPRPGSW